MKKILLTAFLALAACGDDPGAGDDDGDDDTVEHDARPIDAPTTPPDADCVTNPQTSEQILNACTDAERIEKHPVMPLQLPDGGLPPLPQ